MIASTQRDGTESRSESILTDDAMNLSGQRGKYMGFCGITLGIKGNSSPF